HLTRREGLAEVAGIAAAALALQDGGAVLLTVYAAPGGRQSASLCLGISLREPLDLRVFPDTQAGAGPAGTADGQVVVVFDPIPDAARDDHDVPVRTLSCLRSVVDGLAGPYRLLLGRIAWRADPLREQSAAGHPHLEAGLRQVRPALLESLHHVPAECLDR